MIHADVRKIYPDANPPLVTTEPTDEAEPGIAALQIQQTVRTACYGTDRKLQPGIRSTEWSRSDRSELTINAA